MPRLWTYVVCWLTAVHGFSPWLTAQEPVLSGQTPGALLPGQSQSVQFSGANLAGAKRLWLSFPAEVVLTEGIPDNGTKPDSVSWTIRVPAETAVGIYGARVLTDKGVSPLRLVLVDDLPSVPQAGNNHTPAQAQPLSWPCAVDGAVANLAVHYFKIAVSQGQQLSVEVLARRIGSPLDPMLRILDARGRELAFNDDAPGLSGDAQLAYTFPAAGEYLIELRDIRYQGGPYRLRLGDFPCATVAFPLAVQRGVATSVQVAGISTEQTPPATVTAPTDPAVRWLSVSWKRDGGASSGFSQVEVSDRPQVVEIEPNHALEQAQRIELTHDIHGRIDPPRDVDRFVFTANKDQSYVFTGVTRQQGSPADLHLKVLNKEGGQIAAVDDTGIHEGSMTVKFPADGDYVLVVEDLSQRGGPNFAYRVAITPAPQPFQLVVSSDTSNVPAGGAVGFTVTAARQGYNGPIEISVSGLPEGFSASRTVIGPGRNDALLTIQCQPDAPAGVLHTIQVVGTATVGNDRVAVVAEFSGALRQRLANMRFPPPALTRTLAAAVAPAPGFRWFAEPAEIVFGKDLSATLTVKATRSEGFDEAIAIAVQPPQNGLPPGITAAVKNIDKGAGEVAITFSANNQAPLGEFTAGLLGTLKQGDKTVTQPLAVRLNLQPPMTVSVDAGSGKIARGGELAVKVKVVRNPALTAPVNLVVQNLPKGVTAAAANLPPEASEVELKLAAAADADQTTVNNVTVKAEAAAGNAKFEATSPAVALTVE
uniref:Peptidase C-terminal archaeal/bacterial domain-containing protein n=1 Tax=Schlesneria paludicola TaxID=360056 RepID=A0A7C4LJ05_9PLAN